MNTNTKETYNLDISMYSFKEVLELFDLTYNIKLEDLRKAKLKVLSFHPDKNKGKFPVEFFYFFKKAFEIVLNYYQENNKQNQLINENTTKYNPNIQNDLNKTTNKKIEKTINQIKPKEFNKKFNDLFEQNMTKKQNTDKNNWFSNEHDEPIYKIGEIVNNSNMNSVFNNIKSQNNNNHIIKYTGVMELTSNTGCNLYDDDENENEKEYISCDIFNKLKFDDIKKVHRDQTILAVREQDLDNIPKYSSIEHYSKTRNTQDLNPLEKHKSELLLQQKEQIHNEKMSNLRYGSLLKTNEYEQKNKEILSKFLYLQNN
jgi:hypothetical protein